MVLTAIGHAAVRPADDLRSTAGATLTLTASGAVQFNDAAHARYEVINLRLRDLGSLVRSSRQRAFGSNPGVGFEGLMMHAVGDELRSLAQHVESIVGAVGGFQVDARHRLRGPVDQGDFRGLSLSDERRFAEHVEGERGHSLGQGGIGREIRIDGDDVPAGDAGPRPLALFPLPGFQILGGGLRAFVQGALLPALDAGSLAAGGVTAVMRMDRERARPPHPRELRADLRRGEANDA
nr:hypothetical protein [Methylobacterium tardum]